ncbi:MAG: hypothetical protein ACJ8GW_07595 [Massilia sp.]
MDIPALTSIAPGALPGISPLNPTDPLALDTAGENDPLALNQTTVDLSPLGQFFSATSVFQKQILALQAARGGVADAVDPVLDANAVAASAATLADTFNQLQTSSTGQAQDGQSFAALFAQQFGGQTVPADASASNPAALAAIGLSFEDTPAPVAVSTLTVDQPVLIQALATNPAPTAALLGQTAAALGAITGVTPDEPLATAAAPDQVFRTEAQFLTLPASGIATTPEQADASQTDTLKAAQASAEEHLADAQLAEDLAQTRSNSALLDQQRIALASDDAKADQLRLDTRLATTKALEEQDASLSADKDRLAAATNEQAIQAEKIQHAQIQSKMDQQRLDTRTATDKTLEQQRLDTEALVAPDTAQQAQTEVVATSTLPATENPTLATTTASTQTNPDPSEQLARDPAIAAAIAAYNLHTGPFAVLNGRPELAAPRIKPVAPVSEVTRVAPVDASTDLKSGAREFR